MITPNWKGDTVVILGSGPSLTKEDVDYCKGKARVIAINNCYMLAPWADILYACDIDWWTMHYSMLPLSLALFLGERWTISLEASKKYGLHHVDSKYAASISFTPGLVHLGGLKGPGGNSGFQALNLAVLFGVARIILLGFDMGIQYHLTHWHGNHPGKLNKSPNYREFIKSFQGAAFDLRRAGIEVVNCSRESKLECFRRDLITNVL